MKLNIQRPKGASEGKGKYSSKGGGRKGKSQKHPKGAIDKSRTGSKKPNQKAKKAATKANLPNNVRNKNDGNKKSHEDDAKPVPGKTSRASSRTQGGLPKGTKGKQKKGGKNESATPVKAVKKEIKKSKEEQKKDLNKLYSRLLVEHRKHDVVKATITELLKGIDGDNYCVISNKRHISRILQACLKYGDTAVRSLIFQKVKADFTLVNLNAHSSRFLVKLYNYCNTEVKEFLKNAFFSDKCRSLLFSRYGSDVMDTIYQKLKNKEQLDVLKHYVVSNFFLLEEGALKKIESVGSLNQFAAVIGGSQSRDSCVENLKRCVLKMVDKAQLVASLSHDLVYLYWKLTDAKAELISHLHKVFGQLLSTRNGTVVICDLFSYADKKMRKSMLKGLRTDFPEAVYNRVNVSLLIKAIHCTDDTKLSIDCLLRPLQDDLQKVVCHQYGHLFVRSILEPPKDVHSATSLKDPSVRQEELQSFLLPLLVDMFKSLQLREIIESKYASQILMGVLRASKDAAILHSIVDEIRDDAADEMSLLKNLDTLRFVQTLVKKPGPLLDELRPYALIWPAIKESCHRILTNKCVFLLVDIMEAAMKHNDIECISDFKGKITVEKIQELCKSFDKKKEKHAGLDILMKLLTE